MIEHFSPATSNMFSLLNRPASAAGVSNFPLGLRTPRVGTQETTHAYWLRVLGEEPDVVLSRVSLRQNVALLVEIDRARDGSLQELSATALATPFDTLANFWLDPSVECRYHRLDYDPRQPGSLFREPVPHVHAQPHDEPRFPTWHRDGGNLLVDYVEFLYLNYAYPEWQQWADRVWKKVFGTSDARVTSLGAAFASGSVYANISAHADDLRLLRHFLSIEKAAMMKTQLHSSFALLNYGFAQS